MDKKFLKSNTDITLILIYATQIVRLAENVILDLQLTGLFKLEFLDIKKWANNIFNIISNKVNDELKNEIYERTKNNYETGAFDNIMFNLGQMTDEQRNNVDEICSAILEGSFKINRKND
jgi:hypothetical protein